LNHTPNYRPGDFLRVCEVCGFVKRASQTFKRWDGLMVCAEDFETRHPQDFVRGMADRQAVPDPRPETVDNIIGPLTTTLTVAATAASTSLSVDSSVRFGPGDHIGLTKDDGNVKALIILTVPTSTSIQMTTALGGPASVGNLIVNYSAISVADIG
jgi:hypothetical protein